tara:strand:+ start:449 stop:1318 length:870 start_codon:yes stop_codon:yes gene_type:complete
MKIIIKTIFQIFLGLSFFEIYIKSKTANAFIPRINEPNQEELQSTSIQIGKTAIQLIQFGENEEAIKLLKLAVKLNPTEEAFWLSLAEAQVRLNKNIEAISSLNKAIELKPNAEGIFFTKASIYMNLNNPKSAVKIIKKGLTINNKSARGYFLLGNAEIMRNNLNLALDAFKRSSKINSEFWQSINNEGLILYELNKPKQAISKFRLAIKISNNAEPMLALASVLHSIENKSIESITLARNALKSNPNYVSNEYQAKQLWGEKLQKAAIHLFKNKEMIKAVKEAKETSK